MNTPPCKNDANFARERGLHWPPHPLRHARVLDATCGSRMIWFDPDCPDAIFLDKRRVEGKRIWKSSAKSGTSVRHLDVRPDVVGDFTAMPFEECSFDLVVFDPPHLRHVGENAWIAQKYGSLPEKGWEPIVRDGFWECVRVVKWGGTVVFKWSEVQIRVGLVWKALGARPLFGTRVGKNAGTIWACFLKGAGDLVP